jgi:hypothetical protein
MKWLTVPNASRASQRATGIVGDERRGRFQFATLGEDFNPSLRFLQARMAKA